ncbi:MAG TPA: peptide ABC transporter permease [Ignavibacteriales bacterium]|nr:peptide ABC transporter permease [Ignavibacteriales bacterium]
MKVNQILAISLQSLKSNRLRTGLTILGVVVGIFSIIVIMTILTMLQNSINDGLSSLGKNTFQIQKHDNVFGGGPRRDDRNRKDLTIEDAQRLKEMLSQAKYIGVEQWQFGKVAKFGNRETNPNLSIAGVSTDAMRTNDWNVEEGRDFREDDINYSSDVCIIFQPIVEKLFPNISPLGQTIRVDGKPLRVVGVVEKQSSLFGQSRDNYILIPITTWQSLYGRYGRSVNITVMSQSAEDYEDVIEAATGHMRKIRKVAAGEPNDFFIFSNESMMTEINKITDPIKIIALAISLIALIAAGVGIMNIMLVSVTERTREIGIRKALGAKKTWILSQFLFEAIILCMLGGLIGIVIGVSIGNIAGSLINAQSAVPWNWVILGLIICVLVGVVFGTYPAYKAANLDPIEALRYE